MNDCKVACIGCACGRRLGWRHPLFLVWATALAFVILSWQPAARLAAQTSKGTKKKDAPKPAASPGPEGTPSKDSSKANKQIRSWDEFLSRAREDSVKKLRYLGASMEKDLAAIAKGAARSSDSLKGKYMPKSDRPYLTPDPPSGFLGFAVDMTRQDINSIAKKWPEISQQKTHRDVSLVVLTFADGGQAKFVLQPPSCSLPRGPAATPVIRVVVQFDLVRLPATPVLDALGARYGRPTTYKDASRGSLGGPGASESERQLLRSFSKEDLLMLPDVYREYARISWGWPERDVDLWLVLDVHPVLDSFSVTFYVERWARAREQAKQEVENQQRRKEDAVRKDAVRNLLEAIGTSGASKKQ